MSEQLPVITPSAADGDVCLWWPPNRTHPGKGPQVQISSRGRTWDRTLWLDLRGLMQAIAADPRTRAEMEVVLAEQRLADVRAALQSDEAVA